MIFSSRNQYFLTQFQDWCEWKGLHIRATQDWWW